MGSVEIEARVPGDRRSPIFHPPHRSASTCSEKAIKYISKWTFKDNPSIKMEIERLEGMMKGKMKGEVRTGKN